MSFSQQDKGLSYHKIMQNRVVDRISSLPDDILHHILYFVPIKYAIRTSVLSTRWRCVWTFCANLDFDEVGFHSRTQYNLIVDQCLKSCKATTLHKFKALLHYDTDLLCYDTAQAWIRITAAKEIQELDLNFKKTNLVHEMYELPCFLYHCQSISVLKLNSCSIKLPSDFEGFRSLNTLHLSFVLITDEVLSTILLKCPILENLYIMYCYLSEYMRISVPNLRLKNLKVRDRRGLNGLDICAPNLAFFDYGWKVTKFTFENIPRLLEANLQVWGWTVYQDFYNWRTIMVDISHVKILKVCHWFLKFLFAEYYMMKGPFTVFENLKELHLEADNINGSRLLSLVTFVKDCPLLEKIHLELVALGKEDNEPHILVDHHFPQQIKVTERKYWRTQGAKQFNDLDHLLCHLRTFEVKEFTGGKYEMQLVQFILKKAIVLESLLLSFHSWGYLWDSNIATQNELIRGRVVQLPRASSHVQIVLFDPNTSDSRNI